MYKADAHEVALIHSQGRDLADEDVCRLTNSRWMPWLGSCIVVGEVECRGSEERKGCGWSRRSFERFATRPASTRTALAFTLASHVASAQLHLSHR
jgi:hypothetical protein